MISTDHIVASESRPGFFVATCEHCGKIVGVKPSRKEVEVAQTWHICADGPTTWD